jgi:hypothetical protein
MDLWFSHVVFGSFLFSVIGIILLLVRKLKFVVLEVEKVKLLTNKIFVDILDTKDIGESTSEFVS